MYYQVNVSLRGLHMFATAEHSLPGIHKAREVYLTLSEKFPASEGYVVELRKVEVHTTIFSATLD